MSVVELTDDTGILIVSIKEFTELPPTWQRKQLYVRASRVRTSIPSHRTVVLPPNYPIAEPSHALMLYLHCLVDTHPISG